MSMKQFEKKILSRPGAPERVASIEKRLLVAECGLLRIFPSKQPINVGATVLAVVSFGVVTMVAPCRVVWVVNEPDKFGFAYGTLPGHPERGEEAFTVERRVGGTFFSVRAFSQPAEALVRLSGPVGRVAQQFATRRYIGAMARTTR
jgi:uncharacterized protein (UPF0548 family)